MMMLLKLKQILLSVVFKSLLVLSSSLLALRRLFVDVAVVRLSSSSVLSATYLRMVVARNMMVGRHIRAAFGVQRFGTWDRTERTVAIRSIDSDVKAVQVWAKRKDFKY